jgi:hypothetical protein
LRPDTLLLCRDFRGLTPVECALRLGPPETPHLASVLRALVQLRPGSVVFLPSLDPWSTVDEETALHWACRRFRAFPDLIEAIVEAFPPALLFAASETGGLPFEVVAEASDDPELVATLKKNTLHMALAVVEYVLGGGTVLAEDEDTASFQTHITETVVAAFLPEPDLAGGSGFEVALAVGKLRSIVDLVREVFHDERFRDLLRKNTEFRSVVMGEAVVDLYRLNRMGRLNDDQDDDHDHAASAAAAAAVAVAAGRQVGLLASLQDSGTVESTYLHFREVARHVLIPEGGGARSGN